MRQRGEESGRRKTDFTGGNEGTEGFLKRGFEYISNNNTARPNKISPIFPVPSVLAPMPPVNLFPGVKAAATALRL